MIFSDCGKVVVHMCKRELELVSLCQQFAWKAIATIGIHSPRWVRFQLALFYYRYHSVLWEYHSPILNNGRYSDAAIAV